MVENLIAGYLTTGKRLVIPELGAFLKKDTGETVFVEFLKKDDGVLSGLIAGSMGVSAVEAAGIALQFSADIKTSLGTRGFYIIPKVGTLRRDSSGSINLSQNSEAEAPVIQISASQPPQQPPLASAETIANPVAEEPAVPAATTSPRQPEPHAPRPEPAMEQPAASEPVPDTSTQTPTGRTLNETDTSSDPIQTLRAQSRVEHYAPAPEGPRPARLRPVVTDDPRPASRRPAPASPKKKKADLIMIIAIVAALVAIGSMVFGLMVNNDPIMNLQPTSPRTEQSVTVDETATTEGEDQN